MNAIAEVKKAQADTKVKGVSSLGTKYGLSMAYILLLVVFPPLWSIVVVGVTIALLYLMFRTDWWRKGVLIPLWAAGWLAGILTSKKAKTGTPSSSPSPQGS